ncbi:MULTISPECIES: methyl-accepting chemotaxis protein [Pandoraea]|uniref:methyl-accepting chemotaxis protein n=1 Tax=Pandoraea TaxID=93217 RepID=UPI0003C7586A|nr:MULTISPECIES: methyl-accepting chemotaxis protein [Pandoraea]AHB07145.1 chemotaxis protein [Pandoraea pnomenusa 3kgm]AHB76679.1 chemotaxis protein [Pandoraea pnomenusa]AHN74964.2 chemotaxis protein [Pandoraea pnomenusa]MBN9095443.1 chemotaxis protein [Pandoraea pnomenusa]QDH62073.1 chemotaxis protein [Pandoraea pnomenusa]
MQAVQWVLTGALAGIAGAGMVALVVHRWRMAQATAHWRALAKTHDEALAQALERERVAVVDRDERSQAHDDAMAAHQSALAQAELDLQAARKSEAAVLEAKAMWQGEAERIAGEAARLRGLAATFERWHEQMISLMTQNQDMHAKNHELASIVRHVLIVSLNASIEAARAGAAGRGFGIVASEVRALATRSEELSKSYRDSLHRNDVTTTATFQDIQAGGKMIAASLSSVEALAQQLHARLH